MAKRVADEYITKDRDSVPNNNDTRESSPVKMATPAQLAARKIRTPKTRIGARGNSSASTGFSGISAPPSNPFAQQQPQQSSFAPANSSFTFGAPNNSQISFGQNTDQVPTQSLFGQSTSQSAPPSFSFGQPAQTNGGSFSFDSNNNAPSTQNAPPAFSFGQLSQTNANAETPQPAPSTFTFGQPAQTNGATPSFSSINNNTPATQPAPLFSFGQTSQNNAATETPKPASSIFSFGQPSQSNTNTEMTKPVASNIFGQPSHTIGATSSFSKTADTTQSTPSTSIFAQAPQTNGTLGGFNFNTNSQLAPTLSTFGGAQMDDTAMLSPPRKPDPPKSLFQFQASAQKPAASPAPIEQPATSAASTEAPTKSLFQFSATASVERQPEPSPAPIKSPFQFPATASVERQPEPSPAPIKSPFQFPATASVERQSESSSVPTKSLFEFPASASVERQPESAPVKHQPASLPASVEQPAPPTPAAAPKPIQAPAARNVEKAPVQFEKVKLRSNGPSEPLVTNDYSKWTEHDKKYRLRSLNKELVRRLALYDPSSQDFDNVIIFYYQTREKLGLLWPSSTMNTKRKIDEEDRSGDRSSPAKKSKTSESSGNNSIATSSILNNASNSTFGNSSATSDIFSSASNSVFGASKQASNGTSALDKQTSNNTPAAFNVGTSNKASNGTSTPSNAGFSNFKGISAAASAPPRGSALSSADEESPASKPSLFQSLLSASSTPKESTKPKSPFANVPTQPQSAAKSPFSFSQPVDPKVTSPTKPVSPPTSDDHEDEDDAEEQESEEEDQAEVEDEEQDPEGQNASGDDSGSDEDDEEEHAPATKPENVGKSLFDRIQAPASTGGESGVTTPTGTQDKGTLKQPAPNHSFKPYTPFPPGVSKSTPQAPTISPITPFGGSVKSKPVATFDFTPKEPTTTPTPVPGASIFAGGLVKTNGPFPGEGLFGSRPSTPNNDEPAPTNIFAGLAKVSQPNIDPSKDNTWSKGFGLKFGQSATGFKPSGGTSTNFMKAFGKSAEDHAVEDKKRKRYEDLGSDADEDEIEEWEKEYEEKEKAKRSTTSGASFGQGGFKPATQLDGQDEKQTASAPSFSITAATPPSKALISSEKFTNLFGQKSDTNSPAAFANPVGFSFSLTSASALQPAASYLFASANTSGLSSRATSPGGTDNESVGTDGEADPTNDPQTSLMSDRPGEENEEVLYEARTKALKFMDKEAAAKQKGTTPDAYNSVGLGILRVLKNAETNKTRVVIRAEPGANILLNTHLAPFINYTNDSRQSGSGVVRFGVPIENGKIEQWVLKVKDSKKAGELAEVLTNNKSSTETN